MSALRISSLAALFASVSIGLAHAQSLKADDISLKGAWRVDNPAGSLDWTIDDGPGRLYANGEGQFKNSKGETFASTYRCAGSKGEKLRLDCAFKAGDKDGKTTMFFTVVDRNTLSRDDAPFPVIMRRK